MDKLLTEWGFERHNNKFIGYKFIRRQDRSWNHEFYYRVGDNVCTEGPGLHTNTLEFVKKTYKNPSGKIIRVYFDLDDIKKVRECDQTVIVSKIEIFSLEEIN